MVEWDALAGAVAKDTPTDCHSDVREAQDFINMIKRKENAAKNFNTQIATLHKSVIKGKLNNF